MKNEIEILDRYYQSFINQKEDWNFFLGLTDYVKYILSNKDINNILKCIVEAKDNDEKSFKKYEQKLLKEIEQTKDKVFKIIKDHKISYKSLNEDIEEYESYEDGRGIVTHKPLPEVEGLTYALIGIIENLFDNGYKKLVKDFISNNSFFKYPFSKTLNLYDKEKRRLNEKLRTELWASWDNLLLVYLVIFKEREESKRLFKNRGFFEAFNFLNSVHEMTKIKNNSINRSTDNASNNFKPKYFKRENYISYATRINNYLIQELSKKEVEKPAEKKEIKAKAKYNNGILYFMEKEINFRNKQNQKELLATIFEDPKKNWYYDEIEEKWDEVEKLNIFNKRKDYWKKFYSAGNDINTAVAMETQVKDFIIKNTKEIRINPKYV